MHATYPAYLILLDLIWIIFTETEGEIMNFYIPLNFCRSVRSANINMYLQQININTNKTEYFKWEYNFPSCV